MGAERAELELVKYRVVDVSHVTKRLVYNFATYSGIGGAKNWPSLMYEVDTLIRDQVGFNCLWEAHGMDINLSYFLDPRPKIVDGGVIFTSPEPKVTFLERPELVSPSVRTHVGKVAEEIAHEMVDVYHLRVERDPLVLIFPNEQYAQSIERFEVPLLAA